MSFELSKPSETGTSFELPSIGSSMLPQFKVTPEANLDEAAQAEELARRTNVPSVVVASDMQKYQGMADALDQAREAAEAPMFSLWMQKDRRNLSNGRADFRQLVGMERIFQGMPKPEPVESDVSALIGQPVPHGWTAPKAEPEAPQMPAPLQAGEVPQELAGADAEIGQAVPQPQVPFVPMTPEQRQAHEQKLRAENKRRADEILARQRLADIRRWNDMDYTSVADINPETGEAWQNSFEKDRWNFNSRIWGADTMKELTRLRQESGDTMWSDKTGSMLYRALRKGSQGLAKDVTGLNWFVLEAMGLPVRGLKAIGSLVGAEGLANLEVPFEEASSMMRQLYDQLDQELGSYKEEEVGTLAKFGLSFVESIPQMLPQIASAVFTASPASLRMNMPGAPMALKSADDVMRKQLMDWFNQYPVRDQAKFGALAATAVAGAQIFGSLYGDARLNGADMAQAAGAALGDATVQSVMENISFRRMFDIWQARGWRNLGKSIVEAGLTEFATEALQQYPDEFFSWIANAGTRGNETAASLIDRLPEITSEAMQSGLIGAAWAPLLGFGGIRGLARKERMLQQNLELFEALDNSARGSKLREKLPQAYADAVNYMLKDGPVTDIYVSPEAVRRAALATDQDALQLAQTMGVSEEEWAKADETGADLQIPLATWQTKVAGTDAGLHLKQAAKTSPDAMTLAEAEKERNLYAMTLGDALATIQANQALDDELSGILEPIKGVLMATDSGFTEQQAETQLLLMKANAVAWAKIQTNDGKPITPAEFLRAHLPQVRRVDAEGNVVATTEGQGQEGQQGQKLNQFIGEQGAKRLDEAEKTTRLADLDVARQMETAGKDAAAVKLATGWERGKDGKWRYETPDTLFKKSWLKKNYKPIEEGGEPVVIARNIGTAINPEIKKAYPDIKNISLYLTVDPSIEKYHGGFTPYSYNLAMNTWIKGSIDINARSIEQAEMMLNHEIQHFIQWQEGFASGGNPEQFETDEQGLVEMDGKKLTPIKAYKNLAGETEARNASKRMGMTEEERRASLAASTEDVAREDQILLGAEGTPMERTEELQQAADSTGVDTVELNAVTVEDPESRKYMREQMLARGLTNEEADAMLALVDGIKNKVLELSKENPTMLQWQKQKPERVMDAVRGLVPVRSAFKKNGEYVVNFDFGALCTKREAADLLNQLLIDEGLTQQLGPTQIEALKTLLKEEKYLTACDVCFVESKRARMLSDANKTAYAWKSVLLGLGIDDGRPLGAPRFFTEEQIARLERMADTKKRKNSDAPYLAAFEEFIPEERKRTRGGRKGGDLDTGTTPDQMAKIAKLFLEDPSLAGELDPGMLLTTRGTDWLVRTYGPNTNIYNTLAGMYGSATSKPLEGFNIFDNLSFRKDFDFTAMARNNKALFDIGGSRSQSFTDFNPLLFLDYVQMIAELQIRQMPQQVYTKVPSHPKLFGTTGMMINMSLVPAIADGVDAEHAGLVQNEETGEWEYAWSEDSFPVEEAYALREREDFGGRVGTIGVGVSDAHILKMLDDPRIDMVIPYHASGMPFAVKIKTGLVLARDYTSVQTTKGAPKGGDFNYNEALQRLKDPRKAAAEYLQWCEDKGYTPKFPQFAKHENYYKLLEDFRGYDSNGNAVLQGPVQLKLTENWHEVLSEALAERTQTQQALEGMAQNTRLMERARAILKPQRLDGDLREQMMRRLQRTLGKANVQTLRQNDFFKALQDAYAKSMSAEEAKAKVETFRTGAGIVYGFAVNGRIVLNEQTFNGNTPAHEFSHVWAKVAQAKAPEIWKEGKELLKQHDLWKSVAEDPLYRDIAKNEDAIASEVLARFVGAQNEEFVRSILDPSVKMGKGKGLVQQIRNWVAKMFNAVRGLFSARGVQNLTFEEFLRMPMKALWNETEGARFAQALKEVRAEQAKAEAEAVRPQTMEAMQEVRPGGEPELMAQQTPEQAQDAEYFAAIERGDKDAVQAMINAKAEAMGFGDAIPEQTEAYAVRTKPSPKKTIKVYKVFTLAPDGSPTALFVNGTQKLPQGVWLDAQDAYHFQAESGAWYVPSTQNPYTEGGKTGGGVKIPSEEVRQELIARGFLPKGSKAKDVTALAYRPGWHAGTLPFFPQGGTKVPNPDYKGKETPDVAKWADTPYPNVHRYNQVIFECEMAADEDYNAEAQATKDGDLEHLPVDGSYYYATNPLTRANPDLGAWVISGSLKINRALTKKEADKLLADKGMPAQQWEGGTYRKSTPEERETTLDAIFAEEYAKVDERGKHKKPQFESREAYQKWYEKEAKAYEGKLAKWEKGELKTKPAPPKPLSALTSGWGYESGPLDLASLGYEGPKQDAARKTLAPITYDENGEIIPLSKRFDPDNPSVLYQGNVSAQDNRTKAQALVDQINDLFQRAWHGTPHRFDKFTLDHIGSGEGAQVHGWGLYFAQRREVSEGYRRKLLEDAMHFSVNGKRVEGYELQDMFQLRDLRRILEYAEEAMFDEESLSTGGSIDVVKEIQKDIDYADNYVREKRKELEGRGIKKETIDEHLDQQVRKSKDLQELVERIKNANLSVSANKSAGQLFEVEIPDNDTLLDEQKKFEDQPKYVQIAVRSLLAGEEYGRLLDDAKTAGGMKAWHAARDYLAMPSDATQAQRDEKANAFAEAVNGDIDLTTRLAFQGVELNGLTGREIYGRLIEKYGSDKKASLALLNQGVEGITYEGGIDGRCFVIWNADAIEIYNTLYMAKKEAQNTQPRGQFSYTQTQKIITLFNQNADLSTFAHELGHFFFNNMREMVERGEAPEQIAKDYQTLQDYAQSKAEEWYNKNDKRNYGGRELDKLDEGERREAVWRAREEVLAEGWLTYLKEGKAPSDKLKGVFRRFRQWLVSIYKALRHRGFQPINPDVRAVFNRMLASEAECEAAAARHAASDAEAARIDEVGQAMLTAQEQERLKKARVNADDDSKEASFQDALKAYWSATKEAEQKHDAIKREVESRPHFAAMLEALANGGINRQSIVDELGEEDAKALAKKRPGLVRKEGGIDINQVGINQGYEDLSWVDEILDGPTVGEAVKEEMEAWKKQREQEIRREMQPEGVEPGDPAYYNDARLTSLLLEATAMQRAAGRKTRTVGNADAVHEWARRILDDMPMRQAINIGNLSRAEARAAGEAATLLAKGDKQGAADAKRRQAISHAMVLEAMQLRKLRTSLERAMVRWNRHKIQTQDQWKWQEQLRAMAQRYSIGGRNKFAPDRPQELQSLREFIKAYDDESVNGAPPFPDWLVDEQVPDKLSAGQYRDIAYAMKWLSEGMAPEEAQMVSDALKGMSLLDAVTEGVTSLQNSKNTFLYKDEGTLAYKAQMAWNDLFAGLDNAQFVFMAADGYKEIGKRSNMQGFHSRLFQHVKDALSRTGQRFRDAKPELERLAKIRSAFCDRFEQTYGKRAATINGIATPDVMQEIGRRHWTAEMIWSMARNRGNEGNLKTLRNGLELEDDQIDALTSILTAEEWQAVADECALISSSYDDADRAFRSVYGMPMPDKVQPDPFTATTADGSTIDLPGWYFPISVDSALSPEIGDKQEVSAMKDSPDFTALGPSIRRGFTHARTGTGKATALRFAVFEQALWDQWRMIEMGPIVRDLDRLMRNKQWRHAFEHAFGPRYYEQMRQWLKYTARPSQEKQDVVNRTFTNFRSASTIFSLGLNVQTFIRQFGGYPQAIPDVGAGWIVRGLGKAFLNPRALWQEVNRLSPMMADRDKSFVRELREYTAKYKESKVTIAGHDFTRQDVQECAMALVTLGDRMTTYPIWWGAYQRAIQKHAMSQKDAVAYADGIVSKTQAVASEADINAWQRDNGFKRLLSMFMSESLRKGSRMRYWYRAWRRGQVPFSEYAWHFSNETFGVALLFLFMKAALTSSAPDKDDVAWAVFDEALGPIPMLNQLSSVMQYNTSPSSMSALKGFDLIGRTFQKGKKWAENPRDSDAIEGMFKAAVDMAAFTAGTGNVRRVYETAAEGWTDVSTGKSQNPFRMFLKGFDKDKK